MNDDCLTYAIILAAGSGQRMQAGKNKMRLTIAGKSLLFHVLSRFQKVKSLDRIVLAMSQEDLNSQRDICKNIKQQFPKVCKIVVGGCSRQESVEHALQAISSTVENNFTGRILTLVHDGARCFVPCQVIESVISQLKKDRCAVVAAVPAIDTIRLYKGDMLQDLASKEQILQMQTPQAADLDIFLSAFAVAKEMNLQSSDDIAHFLRIGYPVRIVRGDWRNMKLTTIDDFEKATILYKAGYFRK